LGQGAAPRFAHGPLPSPLLVVGLLPLLPLLLLLLLLAPPLVCSGSAPLSQAPAKPLAPAPPCTPGELPLGRPTELQGLEQQAPGTPLQKLTHTELACTRSPSRPLPCSPLPIPLLQEQPCEAWEGQREGQGEGQGQGQGGGRLLVREGLRGWKGQKCP